MRRLQEKAEMRRQAKRELAALHRALASQETSGSSPSVAAAALTASGGAEGSVLLRRKASSVPRIAKGGGDVTDDVSILVEETLPCGGSKVDVDSAAKAVTAAAKGAQAGRGIISNGSSRRRPVDASFMTKPSKLSRQETSLANQIVPEFSIEGNDSESLESTLSSRTQLLVRMGLLRARLEESKGSGEDLVVLGEEAAVGTAKGRLRPDTESLWRDVEELAKSGGVHVSRNH